MGAAAGKEPYRLRAGSNTFPRSTHRKTSLHLCASKRVIKDLCLSKQPDARGSGLAVIVPMSAVGRRILCRILARQLANESTPCLASLVLTTGHNGCYSHQAEQLKNSICEL